MECAFLLACLNLNATSLAIICQTLTKVQIPKPGVGPTADFHA